MKKVFLSGAFDILHRGHVELLKYAKSQGDWLTVAVDTDSRVKEKKGESRPFNNIEDRIFVLSAIFYVNEVFIFATDEELIKLVKNEQPDLLLAGSDWEGKKIVGGEYAKQIVFFPRIEPYSTTRILNEICH
jgi:D-beta-D-heptose 7-phosphate kinase/D-beta-D-heptose 1-phosphate adenosyltransferase